MTAHTSFPEAVPSYSTDFYSDDFIADPYRHYAAMRALGPVVWLPEQGNYAVTRYEEVREALRNVQIFSSARGVAADQAGCDFMKGNTVASDPPVHGVMRTAMAEPLLPGALEKVRVQIEMAADGLIGDLVSRGSFDGITDLARHLPLTIVTELVGLPEDGRENMLKWAAAAFDILGVQNARGREGVETIKEMRRYIETRARPGHLRRGSWTERIYKLAEDGRIPEELCPFLIRDYINPSLDTTISATGQLIHQLGRNPDQWQALRREPSLIANAVNEAVRLGTPIRSFTRLVAEDFELGGVRLPAGARIMIVYASANRDERKFENPDKFDVTRRGAAHVGFGHGPHTCVGMHLARMEMEALLKAMVARVDAISTGEPSVALNNTIAAFATLPVSFTHAKLAAREPAVEPRAAPAKKWLEARIVGCAAAAEGILALDLEAGDGESLPPFEAGAHVDVEVAPGLVRQYSLCGDPAESGRYRLAILKEPASRGGSSTLHRQARGGGVLKISTPRNHFPLEETARRSVLLAGGIGVTPLIAMAHRLNWLGSDFSFHYCVRNSARAAFGKELAATFGKGLRLHLDDGAAEQRLDINRALGKYEEGAHLYCCGPQGFLAYVRAGADAAKWPEHAVHFEYFAADSNLAGSAFDVVAGRSGRSFEVPPGRSILEVLNEAGIEVETSCKSGVCGSCLTSVLEGIPDHRDHVQTAEEKAANGRIAVCCSRSISRRLVLDV